MARQRADKKSLFSIAWRAYLGETAILLPVPIEEYCFAKSVRRRRPDGSWSRPLQFAFDFAWPDYKIAVEVDGAGYMVRRTSSGQMIAIGSHSSASDYEKINVAMSLGWSVFRFRVRELKDNPAPLIALVALNVYGAWASSKSFGIGSIPFDVPYQFNFDQASLDVPF